MQIQGTLKSDFLGASRGESPFSFLIQQRVIETVSTIIDHDNIIESALEK